MKRLILSVAFHTLIIFWGGELIAQMDHLSFQHLTTVDGLPSDNIRSLYQDSRGFIWIGTNEGLARYDGSEIKVYQKGAPLSLALPNNLIDYVQEDIDSNLVIITPGGTTRYDPKTERVIKWNTFLHKMNNVKFYVPAIAAYDLTKGARNIMYHNSILDSIAKSDHNPKSILGLKNKTIWISSESGLHVFDEKTQQVSEFPYGESNLNKSDFEETVLLGEDSSQGVWLLNAKNLIRYDLEKNMFQTILSEISYPRRRKWLKIFYRWGDSLKILFDSHGKVWFAEDGLYMYDLSTKKLQHYQADPDKTNGLSSNNITTLMEDDEGRIWVGTAGDGINIFDPYLPNYEHYQHRSGLPFLISGNNVTGVLEEENGLWVNTGDGFVNYLDFETLTSKKYQLRLEESKFQRFDGPIFKDQAGHLYVYTWLAISVFRFDANLEQFIIYKPDLPFELSEFMNPIPFIDSRGYHYYYSYMAGIFPDYTNDEKYSKLCPLIQYHPKTGEIKKYYADPSDKDSLSFHFINFITESSQDGSIWFGTRNGLSRFDPKKKNFQSFFHNPNDPKSLSTNNILWPYEDGYGNLWLPQGNNGGLNKIPAEAIRSDSIYFERINTQNSKLPSNSALRVQEDQGGNLWFLTQLGPARYDFKSNEFQSFKLPGMGKMAANPGGTSIGTSGQLYFGTPKGLFSFHPDSVQQNLTPPRVYLTNILVNNQSVPIKGSQGDTLAWESPLEKSILFTEKIKLPHWQNDFTFDFTAINFTYGEETIFQYQLENYDEDWKTTTANKSEATYTNMPPGKYTFRVKAANHSRIENTEDALLHITITPPWYWNSWSWSVYLIIILLLAYFLYRYLLNRQLIAAENRRLKELDGVKTQIYTNITHEFRTPLTIISGMAVQVRDNPQKWLHDGVTMILRNTQNLLNLVNQMLDLRKLESGSMKLNMIQADVIPYLKYLLESFHSYAESKDIRVHFIHNIPVCTMDYDPEKLKQIISNLMSNAIKFTKRGGDVYLMVEGRNPIVESPVKNSFQGRGGQANLRPSIFDLQIKVRDTGTGIPEDKISNVFDRFYQADDSATREGEGTGIGLSLTKALVDLIGGSISVTSEVGKGSEFVVHLPITKEAESKQTKWGHKDLKNLNTIPPVSKETLTKISASEDLPLALLVEDNADVVQYLIACLDEKYQIIVAENGEEGIEKALKYIPDIIVSDVMMPKKDGFELTASLKTDTRTSHIPIILLTARADVDSRIEGLSRGADVYLPKPFDRLELLVRMQKLMELRQRLQKHYLSLAGEANSIERLDETLKQEEVMEHEFVRRARQVVEDNLTNYNFTVEDLFRALHMSHSQLHRKLTALTGYSSNQFIRHIRLEKAKILLIQTDEPISNIGYDTGFNNPGYFSRLFKKEVGLSPGEYRERGKQARIL